MPTGIVPIILPRAGRALIPTRRAAHITNGAHAGNGSWASRASVPPGSPLAEAGREIRFERLLRMDHLGLGDELFLGLRVVRVRHTAVHWAHCGALLLVEEANALGALLGHDVIEVLGERRVRLAVVLPRAPALVDRGVRALGLARAAIDALLGDHRGHGGRPPPTTRCGEHKR